VLTIANLAQIVNVLQAVVMTDGPRIWRTPTYWTLHLHKPHFGATALPVDIGESDSLPDGSPTVSATASRTERGLAITLINRHLKDDVDVCIDTGMAALAVAQARVLTAATANAANCAEEPDRVAPADLTVTSSGSGTWRIELPRHSLATVVLRPD
jgi:alpha-L-arabinofuranosidase